jgi:mannose-6-phosphate isomerase-like protein (cupin superfamily)
MRIGDFAMVMHTTYGTIRPYITKDGSQIRELMHPAVHGNRNQSFAEATIPARAQTALHVHKLTEEIYHVTSGTGMMTLGNEKFAVAAGDTICIAPGTPHCIENTGDAELMILCACSPAYSHGDTELLERSRRDG